jgi:hypothetical protein
MSIRHRLLHTVHLQLIAMIMMLLFVLPLRGQISPDTIQLDTVEEVKKKGSIFQGRPGKSLLFSMLVPGTGQIYNKSYLRVPFVWGAVGGMGYLLYYTSKRYQISRDAYIAAVDNLPYPSVDGKKWGETFANQINNATDAADIRPVRDRANKYRQQAIVGFSLVWLAQGIDAFVDAHLKTFDVNNDLSIDFSPRLDDDPYAPMRVGMFLTLK